MPHANVLLVDDEQDILDLLSYNLARDGYGVRCARNGREALEAVEAMRPDALVLDLMMPGVDGLSVCRRLREDPQTRHIPILILTAKSEEQDVIIGLDIGADDYITKPFSPRVLLARLRAVLRRGEAEPDEQEPDSSEVLHRGPLMLDVGRHLAKVDGRELDLTFTEFRILQAMLQRPGWVFNRHQLMQEVVGPGTVVSDRSVDVHMVSLRRKLGEAGRCIQTVRGVGYRFRDE